MKDWSFLKKIGQSTIRILGALVLVLGIPALIYWLWQPGADRALTFPNNAIWLGHGWIGADSWFSRYRKNKELFRSDAVIQTLFQKLSENHINTVYPHLCPAQFDGRIAAYDDLQLQRFLDVAETYNIKVLPWAGGVLNESVRISDPVWCKNFSHSIGELLRKHPRLTGIHINIEPMPDGNKDFIKLLDEVRKSLNGKILSIATYPPPTLWQRSMNVHWGSSYIKEVAEHTDQFVVMMYDTAIPLKKFYILLMKQWTEELITALSGTNVELLLGIPAYEDAGTTYHHPAVENISSALQGISATPKSDEINGIAIYCDWEMTPEKWQIWRRKIQKNPSKSYLP